ncbi:unnamed protein product [Haemonchus placei]|uniref:Uncharacterized protein n=1 Tax=Haemonchus placei TaxID=6290 RepID=A0A3P7UHJ1_HAEPC|nr:unnamed protein product [Haemonchus placei]
MWRQRKLRSAVPFITEPAQTYRNAFLQCAFSST